MRQNYEDDVREGISNAKQNVGEATQVVRKAFYENWRVSAAIGVLVGAGGVLLLQALF